MSREREELVTIIYYGDTSLELQHDTITVKCGESGRLIIPDKYKSDKSIVAVCTGNVKILNKIGERILR